MALFRDARLRRLFFRDDARGLPPQRVARIREILSALLSISSPADLQGFPHWRPHPLKGNLKGYWAVDASPNERIVFRFVDNKAWDISMRDYH